MFACVNLFSLQGQCRTQFRLISLDISNFVSSGETLTYISLLLNLITKNKDINITILMNIIYEASILLLTIMKCYQCTNIAAIIQNKNTSIVCILKLCDIWIQDIFLFQCSLTTFLVLKFLAIGSACTQYE